MRRVSDERTSYFAQRAAESMEAVQRILGEPGFSVVGAKWYEQTATDRLGILSRLRDLRDSAVLAARFGGVVDAEPSEEQVDAVLNWAADRLGNELEATGAELLRDPELRRDARVQFCGEEPRGACS